MPSCGWVGGAIAADSAGIGSAAQPAGSKRQAPGYGSGHGRQDIRYQATLRFYAELTDFLADSTTVTRRFDVPGSVKDMIEACGVPHTEVDLIVVDGVSVGFDYLVQDQDRIAVYPVFESFDIGPIIEVRPEPLRETAFVADVHLGRLARFLRLLGFDTLYSPNRDDGDLARISAEEARILLTRDVELLKRSLVTHGYWVRAEDPMEQIAEVTRRFHLEDEMTPYSRCLACNDLLVSVDKSVIAERLPHETRERVDEFWRCEGCREIYWRGAHHPGLSRIVDAATRGQRPA